MSFSAAYLREVLEACVPAGATGLMVAVSGGGDSASLLIAVAALGAVFRSLPVRAVHVDHGLQAAAGHFRDSCAALCGRLNVPLTIIPVVVELPAGVSVEAAARDARYAALAAELRPGECVLTAHHREDQAETLLLQALRGAGLKGMSAMPVCTPFAGGWHVRPALDVTQAALLEFGAGAGAPSDAAASVCCSAADPMNNDLRYDRVYLRREVWPLIESRWPGAGGALSRAARHVAQAQNLLEAAAAADVARLRDGEALSVSGLRALTPEARINAVRYWLGEAGVESPSAARVTEALRQVFDAAADHLPAVVWGDHALRRYRQRLFLTAAQPPRLTGLRAWPVHPDSRVELGFGVGALRWVEQSGGIAARRLPATLEVRSRKGGETLKHARQGRTQSVQHLCQSLGILPWLREALPLVFAGDALIAVADLWLAAYWCADPGAPGLGIIWEGAPIIV